MRTRSVWRWKARTDDCLQGHHNPEGILSLEALESIMPLLEKFMSWSARRWQSGETALPDCRLSSCTFDVFKEQSRKNAVLSYISMWIDRHLSSYKFWSTLSCFAIEWGRTYLNLRALPSNFASSLMCCTKESRSCPSSSVSYTHLTLPTKA